MEKSAWNFIAWRHWPLSSFLYHFLDSMITHQVTIWVSFGFPCRLASREMTGCLWKWHNRCTQRWTQWVMGLHIAYPWVWLIINTFVLLLTNELWQRWWMSLLWLFHYLRHCLSRLDLERFPCWPWRSKQSCCELALKKATWQRTMGSL